MPDLRDQPEPLHEAAKECLRKIITHKMTPQVLLIPDTCYKAAEEIAEINNFKIPEDLLIVTTSGRRQPGKNPQSISCYSDMITEAFDLLKYENQNCGKVKQRRTVSAHFYP